MICKVFNSAAQPVLLALSHRPDTSSSLYERLSLHERKSKASDEHRKMKQLTNSHSLIHELTALAGDTTIEHQTSDIEVNDLFHENFPLNGFLSSVQEAKHSESASFPQRGSTHLRLSRPPSSFSPSSNVSLPTSSTLNQDKTKRKCVIYSCLCTVFINF